MKKLLWFIFVLAFFLRIYQVGQPVLKEDEFSTVKAAAYIYHCQKDPDQCRYQSTSFKSRLLALITANETVPNLGAEVYFWDFIKSEPSQVHSSRAWPHLYSLASVYHWLGISEFSSRLVSVISGSLLVIAGYWFSRVMGGSVNFSLMYSAILALAFPLVDYARVARMYPLYGLVFLLLVGVWHRSKRLTAGLLFLLAYWLHLLTLILPIAWLVWAIIKKQWRLVAVFILALIGLIILNGYLKVDFFQQQFLGWARLPHWQYVKFLFSYPFPWWIGLALFLFNRRQRYLKIIIIVYLLVLIFITNFPPGGAYVLALLPLSIWVQLDTIKPRWWLGAVLVLAGCWLVAGSGYLYFGRDGQAKITRAYPAMLVEFKPGDKILAVQLRDYYLQDLPPDTPVIDLQENPYPEFSGSGFVVWEQEKSRHFKPEVLNYIRTNFKHLAGEGLDNWGVEIYLFGK
ncbi:hypothetical protein AUJ59_03755 [Candidatus Beckwithbacteria bacterium CG1_02_47_37]|uniref:Glycosyltransferase RgtA/B/C/D-like domain-containing protein n=4 Tax=Candidatus Beckwithiibacteriota TaxID=1752726 RepID=A0A1J4RQB7_9BACT|nr:MAG: hypothetical protein AUJ59_03755 [Candidatus Beckwithbacteria bacterium CG1_02_47_37]PJC66479.1 MAG: hypothetical protein CO018_01705 [Candidatus Beckwithbacteria bacterium CG_4_9_14_0_2_um_filter_47_11]